MDRNIEKEERAMISESTYQTMVNELCNHIAPFKQTNFYFDTKDLSLLSKHIVIRIRIIDSKKYELTCKIKGIDGDQEYNYLLSKDQYNFYLKQKKIESFQLPGGEELIDLYYIVDLSTIRYEIKYDDYLLVIDKNQYDGVVDYNIEIESDISKEHAKKVLFEYKEKYGFTYDINYISKSRRAINKYLNKN